MKNINKAPRDDYIILLIRNKPADFAPYFARNLLPTYQQMQCTDLRFFLLSSQIVNRSVQFLSSICIKKSVSKFLL